jgi:hypothetical protein
MDLDLGGKLALITGGSRGIGRAVGEALAAEGCGLVLVSRRAADLDVARTQIEGRYNVSVRTDAADLGDSTNVARLARLFPDVDILVNNAGAIPGGTLFDVDEALWRNSERAMRCRHRARSGLDCGRRGACRVRGPGNGKGSRRSRRTAERPVVSADTPVHWRSRVTQVFFFLGT